LVLIFPALLPSLSEFHEAKYFQISKKLKSSGHATAFYPQELSAQPRDLIDKKKGHLKKIEKIRKGSALPVFSLERKFGYFSGQSRGSMEILKKRRPDVRLSSRQVFTKVRRRLDAASKTSFVE